MNGDNSLPLEHFIQAVQSQLDNAQTAMAVKARNLDLPLTFAVKDVDLELRAHVELEHSQIRIRPAGPGDGVASVFHLVFTAITRPNIEENAIAFAEAGGGEPLDELGSELSEEERRRLDWVGVRTVDKLREIRERGGEHTIGRVTSLPVNRLRGVLERASRPRLDMVTQVPRSDPASGVGDLLRVRGRNLKGEGVPKVSIAARSVDLVRATETELLIDPGPGPAAGELRVEKGDGQAASLAFDLSAGATSLSEAPR